MKSHPVSKGTDIHTGGIWAEFIAERTHELRRALVVQYLDLVGYVVSKLGMGALGRTHGLVQQDILHFGVLGLMNAIDRYTPVSGVRFETYAIPRIRGAILDELRNLDWVPRSVRDKTKALERTAGRIAQSRGREAIGLEIAEELQMTPDEFRTFLTRTAPQGHLRQEGDPDVRNGETGVEQIAEEAPDPFEQLSDSEGKSILLREVERLPMRERTIIALYYYENLRFGDIGKILRISESRVSQIHSRVLQDLKQALLARG